MTKGKVLLSQRHLKTIGKLRNKKITNAELIFKCNQLELENEELKWKVVELVREIHTLKGLNIIPPKQIIGKRKLIMPSDLAKRGHNNPPILPSTVDVPKSYTTETHLPPKGVRYVPPKR